MLTPLRRKLVVLTIGTAVFLLITVGTFHLTYQRISVIDDIHSLISGSPSKSNTTENAQSSLSSITGGHVSQPSSEAEASAKPTSTTATTPQATTQQKILVVARTKAENTDWVNEKLPDWPTAIYTVDDHNAPLHTSKNKGHEASVYLTYIVDNYDNLPNVAVFIHSHQKHKHGTRSERIYEGIDYDNFESIRALNLDFVKQNGFTNLRCLNNPGCPAEILPFRPEGQGDPLRPQERAMAAAWTELFLNDQVPLILAAPCCAQFAVSGVQIRQRPKADYERFLTWIWNTPLNDFTSGRVFEYLWHVIFGKDPVYCPEEERCYVDQYGTSSALVHQYQNKTSEGVQ